MNGEGGKTLDQRRANHAWEKIISLQVIPTKKEPHKHNEDAKEYAREARKLPARIMAAGLGQALAFIMAKAKKKPKLKQLHDDLTDWVITRRSIPAEKPDSLMQSIIEGDSDFLRRATDEVLAYLVWLNRFAEAEGLTEEGKS
ncbi:MAG: type III-B CRISPR module-associated protein Cmr5 [Nitrospirota bacterium]